jgi:tartrate dehydratase beta subunit/fumarate hydratase class I family protein
MKMAEFHLNVPLIDEEITKLKIGDLVYFSGAAWTCRSLLQKYVFDEGHVLPFPTKKKYHCIHATPLGLTPNLFLDQIEVKDVFWFEELGSIEAAWQLELRDLGPFLVDIDCEGRNFFDELDVTINKNKKEAYRELDVPEEFEYTKLY